MIQTLASIAAASGSSVSCEELFLLLPKGEFASSAELESFVEDDLVLRRDLLVRDGQVAPRGSEQLAQERFEQINLSRQRIQVAESFSRRFMSRCPWMRLVAVSGSMAYGGGKAEDDVDFFLVTRPNRLWITLLFAMIFARIHRLKDPASPRFCFNRILEEKECQETFRTSQDHLFAREALSLRILEGRAFYHELLSSAAWMEKLFPRLYSKAADPAATSTHPLARPTNRFWALANMFAFVALAPYFTLVGTWRNHRLLHSGKLEAQFRTIMRLHFFAYESRKYDILRARYSKVF